MADLSNKKPWQYKTLEDPACGTCAGHGHVGKQPCGECDQDGRVFGPATLAARQKAYDEYYASEAHEHEDRLSRPTK